MKKYLIFLLLWAWLGFALGAFAKLYFTQWQYYMIVIPTILIAAITHWDR